MDKRRSTRSHGWATALALIALLGLGGCASLPQVDRTALASEAIPASPASALARMAVVGQPAADASGFRLLPLGPYSLDARVQLAQRAQATLDVQYYHFADDETGRWLLRALRDAAARGVRVRLLIDDLYTGGADTLFLAFAAHPNIEVRLYNPFTVARGSGPFGRFLAAPFEWGRINHRMHNKLFIADGAWAVMGGRNIANEYYLRKDADNFIDVDALVAGFVLPPLQALFDRYWNSDAVFPLQAVVPEHRTPDQARAAFEAATDAARTPPPGPLAERDVLGYAPVGAEFDAGAVQLHWGSAYVFADHPDKPFEGGAGGDLLETSVTYNLFEAIRMAEREVQASSPYFIPGVQGMALISGLRQRGVQVSVLTNSLASTDEPLVHLAYARYREPLLALGVELYELSHRRVKDNMRMFLFGASLGRLHAKTVIIDRRVAYIGSMNLDPRSATINTELGAVVDSPRIAAELMHLIEIDRLHSAYRVRRTAGGGCCEWVAPDSDRQRVLTLEPDSAWWMRWWGSLLQPLAPEAHL